MTTIEKAKKGIELWSIEARDYVKKIESTVAADKINSLLISIYDELDDKTEIQRMIGLKIRLRYPSNKIKIDIL